MVVRAHGRNDRHDRHNDGFNLYAQYMFTSHLGPRMPSDGHSMGMVQAWCGHIIGIVRSMVRSGYQL